MGLLLSNDTFIIILVLIPSSRVTGILKLPLKIILVSHLWHSTFCSHQNLAAAISAFCLLAILAGSGRTLRETALESPQVVDILHRYFISSWSLVDDLKVKGMKMEILRFQ